MVSQVVAAAAAAADHQELAEGAPVGEPLEASRTLSSIRRLFYVWAGDCLKK